MWKLLRALHISTPPTTTANNQRNRRYTNISSSTLRIGQVTPSATRKAVEALEGNSTKVRKRVKKADGCERPA